jgi:hypothetical protein
MRASEFIIEDSGTVSGDIAVVPFSFHNVQRRVGLDKYPNNVKKVKGNARRRFKNSISN